MGNMYLCIDLKSFYASVECVERGLDSMEARLVVADKERSDRSICLAITPALKAMGIKNRCRLYEIPKNLDVIIAPPRMRLYIEYSAIIYQIYLSFVSKDDIHVYSIDEAFIDVTNYLSFYDCSAYELGLMIMNEIYKETGIRSSCGVGTNLYLAKIALDITAKHSKDFIGELTEESYIATLWDHVPLTDFWRIGPGIAKRLYRYGIVTQEQIAKADEDLLYKLFGRDAELLIDHAWGRETVTIEDIKRYKPKSHSISSGQVLFRDYKFDEGRLIVKEMADLICLELASKNLVTDSITIHIGYSYGINLKSAHKTAKLERQSNSPTLIVPLVARLYDEIVERSSPIRRVYIICNNTCRPSEMQLSIFDTGREMEDRKLQGVINGLKNKYGKNAIFKGMNLLDGGTTIERNNMIGGHRSGEETFGQDANKG